MNLFRAIVIAGQLLVTSPMFLADDPFRQAADAAFEAESAARKARLEATAEVYLAWIADSLDSSAEQQLKLREFLAAEVDRCAAIAPAKPEKQAAVLLSSYAPIEFTNPTGSAVVIGSPEVRLLIRRSLTPAQLIEWRAADAERGSWLAANDLDFLHAVVDESLGLSDTQSQLLRTMFEKLIPTSSSRLISFADDTSVMRYLPGSIVGARLLALRPTPQQEALVQKSFLVNAAVFAGPRFVVSADAESSIRTQSDRYRAEMNREIEKTVSQLAREWMLDPMQEAELRLAGKGAVTRTLSDWREKSTTLLEDRKPTLEKRRLEMIAVAERLVVQRPEMNVEQVLVALDRNDTVSLPGLNARQVLSSPVWRATVARFNPANRETPTARRLTRQAIASFVLVTLDRELWLLEPQREPLRGLVVDSVPEELADLIQPGRELAFLAVLLQNLPRGKLSQLLSPQQMSAFDQLKTQFHYEPGAVRVKLSDGSLFRVPTAVVKK